MAPQPVEAVWFFRWEKAVSQATYNRINPPPPASGGQKDQRFTKNHIQVSGDARKALDQAIDRAPDERVPILWKWPGGSQDGEAKLNSKTETPPRVLLTWGEGGRTPTPWKLGNLGDPLTTIKGDPTQDTISGADAALQAVRDREERPWLLAVKLQGEDRVLHTRAVLENPPPHRAGAALDRLPAPLLARIKSHGSDQSGVYQPIGSPPPEPRAKEVVGAINRALVDDPNVLLVGPPGTGKTVVLEDLRTIVEHAESPMTFDPGLITDPFASAGIAGKVISLVFHPSYSYEDFVAGLLPESDGTNFRLVARPGPLVSLAHWAGADTNRRALLILDEFNRGPAAAIFGDTLALLDASKRHATDHEGAHITRPFPNEPMQVVAEFAGTDGDREVAPELRLPRNVQIVAALNSSDRSVAPLDAALRRRFAIIPVGPDLDVFAEHLGVSRPGSAFTLPGEPDGWTVQQAKQLAIRLLETLNERIGFVMSEDFLLGHALLWPVGDADDADVRQVLCDAFDNRIVQSLRLTFTDQDELLAAVLGVGAPEDEVNTDLIAVWQHPPEDLAAIASPALRLRSLGALPWIEAGAALHAMLD
jgi:5-methylcytosine-specific restriction protein B